MALGGRVDAVSKRFWMSLMWWLKLRWMVGMVGWGMGGWGGYDLNCLDRGVGFWGMDLVSMSWVIRRILPVSMCALSKWRSFDEY